MDQGGLALGSEVCSNEELAVFSFPHEEHIVENLLVKHIDLLLLQRLDYLHSWKLIRRDPGEARLPGRGLVNVFAADLPGLRHEVCQVAGAVNVVQRVSSYSPSHPTDGIGDLPNAVVALHSELLAVIEDPAQTDGAVNVVEQVSNLGHLMLSARRGKPLQPSVWLQAHSEVWSDA